MENHSSEEDNEVIEWIYQGEVADSVDIPKGLSEEAKAKIKTLGEKGILYNKKMHEIAVQQGKLEEWNNIIENMKGDPEKVNQFVKLVETHTGVKITKQQKEDMLEGDFDIGESKLAKKIEELESKIEQQSKSLEERERNVIIDKIKETHQKLSEKYNGEGGYPKYDSKAVSDYIAQEGLYHQDIFKNYEQAYLLMNFDKIKKTDTERASETERKRIESNEKMQRQGQVGIDGAESPPASDISKKSMDDLVEEAIKEGKGKIMVEE